ncbi:MAG: hypothetical protein U9N52_13665 [Campylobacterota bacterium]|nr:hypothetical protein [Campylobacterota bacterium]
MHDVVVIALSSPLLIGIYKDGSLIETIVSDEQTSEALPKLFEDILKRYEIKNIVYANGPGSFMAIKVAYIFLKTLCIINNYTLHATDAFFFNENTPIKAIGKLCFVKTSQRIETQTFEKVPPHSFALPKQISMNDFDHDTLPSYGIAAVG